VLGILGVVRAKLLGKACVLRSESERKLAGEFVRTGLVRRHPALDGLLAGGIQLRNGGLRGGANRFISISTAITEEYLHEGIDGRQITMIPNGVDTERFCPPCESEVPRFPSELGLPEKWLLAQELFWDNPGSWRDGFAHRSAVLFAHSVQAATV
jgi:glycosyltransferase involved in cell wall biosynthesis